MKDLKVWRTLLAKMVVFAYILNAFVNGYTMSRDDDAWYDFSQSEEVLTKALWFKSSKDVKKAALAGRQLEAVVHADKCQFWNGPDDMRGLKATIIQRFQVWQWMTHYQSLYNGEVIVLPTITSNNQGDVANEEYVVMSNGAVLWAALSVTSGQKVAYICQLGTSMFLCAVDESMKTAKTSSDAMNLVLTGNYNTIVAIVDYSKCELVRKTSHQDSPTFNIINGGVIDDHIVMETRLSGPLIMNSMWLYLTKYKQNLTATVGSDFQLSQDNSVFVDSFRVADGGPPIDIKFNCTYGNGVQYYF